MKIEMFQRYLLAHLNIPYIYGGKNPLEGEDCSGLICDFLQALGRLNTNEEFNAQQLYNLFLPSSILGAMEPGSLIFYGKHPNAIEHVAMFFDSYFIIEAGHGTADTKTKELAAKRGAYSRIRPYKYRTDLVGILKIELGLVP